jgi:hypothetical protein
LRHPRQTSLTTLTYQTFPQHSARIRRVIAVDLGKSDTLPPASSKG